MTFENIIAEAQTSIEANGYIDLPERMKIWNACGELAYSLAENAENDHDVHPKTKQVTTPLKKRVRLGELCVRKVLPLWEEKFAAIAKHEDGGYAYLTHPNREPEPYELSQYNTHMMNLITSYLYSDTTKEVLKTEMEKSYKLNRYLIVGSVNFLFVRMVSFLATRVLYDEVLFHSQALMRQYEEHKDYILTSDDLDNECYYDVERCAAYAYATYYDEYGEEIVDEEKWTEFWRWYIDEAVPSVLFADTIEELPKQDESIWQSKTITQSDEGEIITYVRENHQGKEVMKRK